MIWYQLQIMDWSGFCDTMARRKEILFTFLQLIYVGGKHVEAGDLCVASNN